MLASRSPSWLVRRTTSTTVPHCEKNSTMSSSVALRMRECEAYGCGVCWGGARKQSAATHWQREQPQQCLPEGHVAHECCLGLVLDYVFAAWQKGKEHNAARIRGWKRGRRQALPLSGRLCPYSLADPAQPGRAKEIVEADRSLNTSQKQKAAAKLHSCLHINPGTIPGACACPPRLGAAMGARSRCCRLAPRCCHRQSCSALPGACACTPAQPD